jgi:hypothetical protein
VNTVTLSWDDPEDAARFLQFRQQSRDHGWLPDPSAEELLRLVSVSEVKDGGEDGSDDPA